MYFPPLPTCVLREAGNSRNSPYPASAGVPVSDPLSEPGSHGPGDVGRVLLGLHAQHGDAGRAPLELGLGLEGRVAVGGRREDGVGAEEVVEGDVSELVLLAGEAHVAVVGSGGSRGGGGGAGGVGVGGDARRGSPGQHAGGHHGATGGRTRPQVVGDLMGIFSH